MARIVRIISVIFSCCACAAMVFFSSRGNNDAVYTCMILCLVSFFVNMLASAQENRKKLEDEAKKEAEQVPSGEQMSFDI